MVTVAIGGITTQIPVGDLDFYKKAGYSIVENKPVEPAEKPALVDMTLEQLKAEAKERGLEGTSRLNKEDLLALLQGENGNEE